MRRVLALAGAKSAGRLHVVEGDIRSPTTLARAFAKRVDAVIHFAGLKAVEESTIHPLHYWDVNLVGTCRLLEAMQSNGCHTLVFSSSATVYGIPNQVPIPETAPVQHINPYECTKAAVEQMLADVFARGGGWRIARLRYFNPVGAHHSGQIGERPCGTPSNLLPLVAQVAAGLRECLQVYGGDWPTSDGFGVRDYIHVMDLAEGH